MAEAFNSVGARLHYGIGAGVIARDLWPSPSWMLNNHRAIDFVVSATVGLVFGTFWNYALD